MSKQTRGRESGERDAAGNIFFMGDALFHDLPLSLLLLVGSTCSMC